MTGEEARDSQQVQLPIRRSRTLGLGRACTAVDLGTSKNDAWLKNRTAAVNRCNLAI
jgi:hypothetical protein